MSLPRWRREQETRQKRKFAIALRLVIVILFLIPLAVGGLFLGRELRSSRLPPDSRVTLALRTSPVLVISLNPPGELTIISLPEKTYVEVPHGFGSYRLGAVWDLGELEKRSGMGGELLAETTQELLAVPVDGWLGTEENFPVGNTKEEILNRKNALTSWGVLLRPRQLLAAWRSLQTNLSVFDVAKIWYWTKNIRFDKIYFLDLAQTPALSPLTLGDGSQATALDQPLLDTATEGLFKDIKLANEQIPIEVLNGAEKPGLATRVARLVTNLGGRVINVANGSEKTNQCQLKGEARVMESFTAGELKRIFNCREVGEKPDSRADLQITVGEDYWRKLFQPAD